MSTPVAETSPSRSRSQPCHSAWHVADARVKFRDVSVQCPTLSACFPIKPETVFPATPPPGLGHASPWSIFAEGCYFRLPALGGGCTVGRQSLSVSAVVLSVQGAQGQECAVPRARSCPAHPQFYVPQLLRCSRAPALRGGGAGPPHSPPPERCWPGRALPGAGSALLQGLTWLCLPSGKLDYHNSPAKGSCFP